MLCGTLIIICPLVGAEPLSCGSENLPQQEGNQGDISSTLLSASSRVSSPPQEDSPSSCLKTPGHPPPVLELPDELLSAIFIHCVPQFASAQELQEGRHALNPFDPHPHAVRRCLTQVCRRWRIVAIDTSMLWTTLVLGRTLRWDHENLKQWLTYSRACPLSILIRPRQWSGSKTRVSTLLRLLKGEIGRIRCFMAQHLHWEELLELFPVSVTLEFPLMEVFYIREYTPRVVEPEDGLPLPEPDMGRVYAPKLVYLELAETHLLTSFMTTSVLPIQFLILAAAKFPVPSSTYLQFLACCPDLSSLWVFNEVPLLTTGEMWPETRLTLPRLRDLRFYADHTPDTMLLLRSIHIPSLLNLRFGQYDFSHHPSGFVLQVFWHFLTETASTLENITLSHESLPIGDNLAGPLLRNMANLKKIVIHDVQLKPDLLECLIPDQGKPLEQWPCPRLTSLTLENVDIEGDALPRLISARALSDKELRDRRETMSKHNKECTSETTVPDIPDGQHKDIEQIVDKSKNEDNDEDAGKDWDIMTSISSVLYDPLNEGRLVWVDIAHCSILAEETLTALVELEKTHSHVLRFRRPFI